MAHLETAGCAYELGGVDIRSTLVRLLEGALTVNDLFECARESTNSPWATWMFSFAFVMLTTVLLLNMLIAMCAAAPHTELWSHTPAHTVVPVALASPQLHLIRD